MTFRWKDYAHGNRQRLMTLDAVEFIRRFLLHILRWLAPPPLWAAREPGPPGEAQAVPRAASAAGEPYLPVPPDAQAPPAPDQPAAVCPACQRGECPGWKPSSSPTSSRGGCSRRAGILPNRTARWADRWADHIPLSVAST